MTVKCVSFNYDFKFVPLPENFKKKMGHYVMGQCLIFTLITRHANRIFFALYYVTSFMPSSFVLHLAYLCLKRHEFAKKVISQKHVISFYLKVLSQTILLPEINQQDIIINVFISLCKRA
jgi:hypothetical protein